MIFRTINTDAKKLTEQFGLLNKSFRDIKKDFANGLGFKNSLFQTSISKSDLQSLQKFNSAIKVTNDGLTKSQRITKAWNENMTGCSMVAKRMGNELITGKKKISDISNSMKTATASTKALGVAMNVFANVGFMLAITAITKVVTELAQAQENAVQTAKEATEAYKDEISSIADYKQRLSELHKELNSGNLSYEETKTKRTELMSIQDELIKKFGTEKGAIASVTEAVNGQVDALDNLTEKAYRDWVAKADEQTFWNKLLPVGKSGLDQAIDYMETEKTVSFFDMQNANLSDELQEIQKEIDKTIQSKYNLEKSFATFNVTGRPDEIKEQLDNILQDYMDLSKGVFVENGIDSSLWDDYRKEVVDSINEAKNKVDKGLKDHQETYKTYIEGLIKYDSEYSDEYANILQKRAELESAQNSGNKEEIQKARQAFMDAINKGIEESGSNENIRKYFESLYPELQSEFSDWAFEFDLKANVKGLNDVANEIGEKYSATDLLDMINTEGTQEGEESFNKLIDKAIEYGVCTDNSAEEVQKLIDLLVELGIVQGKVQDSTTDEPGIFSGFSEEQTKDIDTLQSEVKDLYNALSSINSGDFNNSSVIDLIQSFPELTSHTDNLSEAIEKLANDRLETLINDLRKAGASEEIILLLKSTYEESIFAGMGINSMSDALKNLQGSDQALKDLKKEVESTGKISNETINSLINSYPELSNVLIGYVNNLYTEKDVIESLSKVYDTDYNNYVEYYKHKMQYNTEFYDNVIKNVDIHIKNLAKSYGIDLENCKNLAQAKLEVESKLVQEQLRLWSTYYSTLSDVEKENLYTLDPKTGKPVKTANHGLSWRSQTLENDANKINSALDNVTADFVTNVDFTSSNSNKSGSKDETKSTIDWIERKLTVLQNKIDSTKAKFENLFTFKAKNNNLGKQITQTETLLNATKKAADKYLKKANSVKLSEALKKKVREGSYDINDYDSKTADKIRKYQEWY